MRYRASILQLPSGSLDSRGHVQNQGHSKEAKCPLRLSPSREAGHFLGHKERCGSTMSCRLGMTKASFFLVIRTGFLEG
jgi:hypothetical protein